MSRAYDARGNRTSSTNALSDEPAGERGAAGRGRHGQLPVRRVEKVSASATTIYAYDGDNSVDELGAGGSSTARYTQGLGIDQPLAMYRGGAASYYHADGLGSIEALTDSK